jgi:hypothetical protein
LGPFKEINATSATAFAIRNSTTNTVIPITGAALNSVTFKAGKIYTIFINGTVAAGTLGAKIITHN